MTKQLLWEKETTLLVAFPVITPHSLDYCYYVRMVDIYVWDRPTSCNDNADMTCTCGTAWDDDWKLSDADWYVVVQEGMIR